MISTLKTKFRWYYPVILIFVFLLFTVGIDLLGKSSAKVYPQRPNKNIKPEQNQVYWDLANGVKITDWNRLDETLEYINGQYDTSDFDMVNLVRIIYEYGDQIPVDVRTRIDQALLNFRYWWDEPGGNSLCYWSENHQILFAAAEYLVGQKYPDTLFPKSGLTGKQHMAKARQRALDWMGMRWKYGFTEFYSNVYYTEDIGGMINLIDFADEEVSKKMQIIMDLLLYDVAAQNVNTMFISVSGRAYERNRKGGPKSTLGGITNYYWGDGEKIKAGLSYGLVTTKKYKLPQVLKEIAKDTATVVIKQCNGLDISELKSEGYYGTDTRSMMMQWGMEAFTNPEIVRNSLHLIRKNDMTSNAFLKDFKFLDFSIFRWLHLEPFLVRMINPQSNGVAIQKGNTYTYKTKDYSIYTAQDYHPGTYGDQQHVAGMNIGNSFSIFHSHPAVEKDKNSKGPGYWVSYGHLPHVAQEGNVNLSIYNIPRRKGLVEYALLDYTHAYFPGEKFDTIVVTANYAIGKKGDTYCAFIGKNPLSFRENTTDDLIQQGKQTFWIMEGGSKAEDHSFGEFCARIQKNQVTFDSKNLELTYSSKGKKYELTYDAGFLVNGKLTPVNYSRYDSPYCKADRKAETINFVFHGKSLHLDFNKMERDF